jgi:GTPase SAR1 family protein
VAAPSSAATEVPADYASEYQAEHPRIRPIAPAVRADQVKIGLWGSPSSGKTTYLGALCQAAEDPGERNGDWAIYPLSTQSAELIIRFTDTLVNARTFPEKTPIGASTELSWLFIGDLAGSRLAGRKNLLARQSPAQSKFRLDVIDVSGEAFATTLKKEAPLQAVRAKALDHLTQADGLIYLFDPISERDDENSAEYMNRTIVELSRRLIEENRLYGRHFPHEISICITKFDHPQVFQQARKKNLVNDGPDGSPRVLGKDAKKFFDMLCDGTFWDQSRDRSDASAQYIGKMLRKFFHPQRTHYYVSSSIGFRRLPAGNHDVAGRPGFGFDPDNFQNYIENHGAATILGPISPINVIEPLVSLHQRIAAHRRTGG